MPRRSTVPATDRQREALVAVKKFRSSHGYGPSVRDVADDLKCQPPTALGILHRLVRDGRMTHAPGVPRTWEVKGGAL